jgi:hypothetical protein
MLRAPVAARQMQQDGPQGVALDAVPLCWEPVTTVSWQLGWGGRNPPTSLLIGHMVAAWPLGVWSAAAVHPIRAVGNEASKQTPAAVSCAAPLVHDTPWQLGS